MLFSFLLLAFSPLGLASVWLFRKHYWKAFAASLVLILVAIVFVCIQQPWKSEGEQHIVKTLTVAKVPIKIVQIHDGYGLYGSFVVTKGENGKWKWYCIGNDDLYWFTVGCTETSTGSINISKFGQTIALFDPTKSVLSLNGVPHPSSFESFEPP